MSMAVVDEPHRLTELSASTAEDVEEDRISTRRVGKLPASERVTLGLELVEGRG